MSHRLPKDELANYTTYNTKVTSTENTVRNFENLYLQLQFVQITLSLILVLLSLLCIACYRYLVLFFITNDLCWHVTLTHTVNYKQYPITDRLRILHKRLKLCAYEYIYRMYRLHELLRLCGAGIVTRLRAGRSVFESRKRQGIVLQIVKAGSEVHPADYPVGSGFFPRGRITILTTHLNQHRG